MIKNIKGIMIERNINIEIKNIKKIEYLNFDKVDDVPYDEDEIDIIIEVDENEEITNKEAESTEESEKSNFISKHKIEGKHSLKYDSIFKGKKEELDEKEGSNAIYYKDTIEVDKSSNYHTESINHEEYIRSKEVKEKVYNVLKTHTSINFLNNRRKPSKVDFNIYYELLKINLKQDNFSNIELFNELSVYFSDNLFNMFKLLDNKWRNEIVNELQDHIGKDHQSNEIINRNIYEGTEIEFEWEEDGETIIITGSVLETDYQNSIFKIDSYENFYIISINNITKILNNTKFKYNLNKLNNIDFL